MALLDGLRRLFGAGGERDDGIYVYVRCGRCGERVRVRINPRSELQQEFQGDSDRVAGYFVRKMVVDQRCFRPIEVRMQLDPAHRVRDRAIEGGAFLTRAEFEAEA